MSTPDTGDAERPQQVTVTLPMATWRVLSNRVRNEGSGIAFGDYVRTSPGHARRALRYVLDQAAVTDDSGQPMATRPTTERPIDTAAVTAHLEVRVTEPRSWGARAMGREATSRVVAQLPWIASEPVQFVAVGGAQADAAVPADRQLPFEVRLNSLH